MKTFTISIDWLIEHDVDVDIDEFIALMESNGFYFDDDGVWTFTAEDLNNDNIPDFLADIIFEPLTTNTSQGGVIG